MLARLTSGLLLLAGLLCLAQAQDMMGVGGYMANVNHACTGGYTGPGDSGTQIVAFYGLRASSSTNCNVKAVNIRRTSDSHTCDVLTTIAGVLGNTANCSNGGDNAQSASSFCNATTCFVVTWYDQIGTVNNNQTQATTANQPQLIFNCINTSLPCVQFNGTTQWLLASACQLTGDPFTSGLFGERTGNTGSFNIGHNPCQSAGGSGQGTFWQNAVNSVACNSGGAQIAATASDSAFHSFVCSFASVSNPGNFVVDGTNTNGGSGASFNTGNPGSIGAADNGGSSSQQLAGKITEAYDFTSALSVANMQAVCHNQSLYYGTPSC